MDEDDDERTIVSKEMVKTNIIRNVCSLSRTSKYGIARNSVNALVIRIVR